MSLIEGFVEYIVIIFRNNSSVHYKECPLLRASIKREFTVAIIQLTGQFVSLISVNFEVLRHMNIPIQNACTKLTCN